MNVKKEIWLVMSGFGIMFALLSWGQESNILSIKLNWHKGLMALVSGFFLFLYFRKSL